jgi:hypothetical protein
VSEDQGTEGEGTPQETLPSRLAEGIELHGGLILIAGGAVLIALACLFSRRAAVAPIFASFGSIAFVLGVFYSRIEGRMEASRSGMVATVRAVRRRAREEDLPVDVTEAAVDLAVSGLTPYLDPARAAGAAEDAAQEAIREARRSHDQLIVAFAAWLADAGFEVREQQDGFDLLGIGDEEVVAAEAKVSFGSGTKGLRWLEAPVVPEADGKRLRRALVVPVGTRLRAYLRHHLAGSGIEVYEVDAGGTVRPLVL